MRALVLAPGETLTRVDALALARRCDVTFGCNLTCRVLITDHQLTLDWQLWMEYREDLEKAREAGSRLYGGKDAAQMFGIERLRTCPAPERQGLSSDPERVMHHGSSGHAAIGLAYAHVRDTEAPEIWLLGFTCTRGHFHGDHTGVCDGKARKAPVPRWVQRHRLIAADAQERGVVIKDFTRGGRLNCYEDGDWSAIDNLPIRRLEPEKVKS